MSLVVMPATIVAFLRGSWSTDPHDPHTRSDWDHGPARVRRRFTSSPCFIRFTGVARRDKFLAFQTFYRDDLNQGADWFIAKVWNGHDYDYQTVRFKEPYQANDQRIKAVDISFSLEMRPVSSLNELLYWYLTNYTEDWFPEIDYVVNSPNPTSFYHSFHPHDHP